MAAAPRGALDLVVRIGDAVVGRMTREVSGRVRFALDEAWVQGGQQPALGLAFLNRPEPRTAGTGLPTWFENLLPEAGTPLRRRICSRYGIRDNDSAGLLKLLGDDLPGAAIVEGVTDEASEAEQKSAAEPRLRFSLAGVQLKFSVVAAGDRLALPVAGQDGRYIAKVAGSEHPELPEVEAATMAWGRACGLEVPDFRVVDRDVAPDLPLPDEARTLFVVSRFDRAGAGGRVHQRVHQEDLAQALEIAPAHKYCDTGPRRASFDSLTRFVRDACGAGAGREMVRRLAFMVASGNGDAHLKNWTVQWRDPAALRPSLSPNYDLVATIAWDAYGWKTPRGPRLALALGKARTLVDLDGARIERFAERSGVVDAKAIFDHELEVARAAWRDVRESAPQRMRTAIGEHWGAVPLLKRVGPLV